MEALLWLGKYYYAGGVTKKDEWCRIIQAEMEPNVEPYLNGAWAIITGQPTECDPM
jgi:hypothetical protein